MYSFCGPGNLHLHVTIVAAILPMIAVYALAGLIAHSIHLLLKAVRLLHLPTKLFSSQLFRTQSVIHSILTCLLIVRRSIVALRSTGHVLWKLQD
jgi:hypothetical protein